MALAALRRFAIVLLLSAAGTAAGSIVLGVLVGASLTRALSIGFYVMGLAFLLGGFFVGNRGPVRVRSESGQPSPIPFTPRRSMRWATRGENEESLNLSALFVALGLAMIVLGVAADTRHRLY